MNVFLKYPADVGFVNPTNRRRVLLVTQGGIREVWVIQGGADFLTNDNQYHNPNLLSCRIILVDCLNNQFSNKHIIWMQIINPTMRLVIFRWFVS